MKQKKKIQVKITNVNDFKFNKIKNSYSDRFTLISIGKLIESDISNLSIEERLNKQISTSTKRKRYAIVGNCADFTNLNEFALDKFVDILDIIIKTLKAEEIVVNYPPRRIREKLLYRDDFNVREEYLSGDKISLESLSILKSNLDEKIIGHDENKIAILEAISQKVFSTDEGPVVLGFIGQQGVGKTEIAKIISESLYPKKELFREQMSMLNNGSALEYLFGGDLQKITFSKALQQRESNVLLLDEFNRMPEACYSAFFQLFDEGIFKDKHYDINLKNSIIICTSNFLSSNEMSNSIGFPLYSRFSMICNFKNLREVDYRELAKKYVEVDIARLNDAYKEMIDKDEILRIISKVTKFKFQDVRDLKKAINSLITRQLLKKMNIL